MKPTSEYGHIANGKLKNNSSLTSTGSSPTMNVTLVVSQTTTSTLCPPTIELKRLQCSMQKSGTKPLTESWDCAMTFFTKDHYCIKLLHLSTQSLKATVANTNTKKNNTRND